MRRLGRPFARGRAGIGARAAACAVAAVVGSGALVLGDAGQAVAATVTVQPGQTLDGIAAELHTTVAALVAANHLADPNRVLAGSVLEVPAVAPAPTPPGGADEASVVVVVGRGDTLSSLAARYGTTVAAIATANGLADPNRVLAGARLRIPLATSGGATAYPAQLLADPERESLLPDFAQAASSTGVPVSLLEALCWWESGWQASVVSSAGAVGVCQIEPATAAFVNQYLLHGALDPRVPAENIELGAAFLASLLRATGGDVGQALAGYYQGLSSVRRHGVLASTASYVRGVEAVAGVFGQ